MSGIYDITPVPAPRMTQADRWKKRPPVLRYFAFRDEVKAKGVTLPDSSHIVFILPMPPSWSEKKRKTLDGDMHCQKPDVDNLAKALLDSVYGDDCHIHDIRVTKYWGREGKIVIKPM